MSSGGSRLHRLGLDLLIVLSLGLGIGALSTAGSIVHAVLVRALPFRSPERLVLIGEAQASAPEMWRVSSYPDYLDWKAQSRVFSEMAISRPWEPSLRLAESERVSGAEVSEGFSALLGLRPALGRTFTPADFRPGAEPVVVLGHQLWKQRFGGNVGIIGRTIFLDGTASTVIGILPDGVALDEPVVASRADLLKPLNAPPGSMLARRGVRVARALARLADGVTLEGAAAEMRQIEKRLAAAYPETNKDLLLRMEPLLEVAVAGSRPLLLALLGASALLFLIACVNAASVRSVELSIRRRELALRAALGAGSARLFRQLLRESLPRVGMAFVLGLLLTVWAWDTFMALLPASLVHLTGLALDGRVLALTALVSLLALGLVDLLPFLRLTRLPVSAMLAGSSVQAGESGASRRGRNALVTTEIALSLALLIGAGLLVRSLVRLSRVDLGFRPERVLALSLDLSSPVYAQPGRATGFLAALLRGLERPGIRSASVVTNLPLQQGGNMSGGVGLRPGAPLGWQIDMNGVGPGYFSTLGIPLLRGRDFTPQETADDRHPVVILSASAARRLWPGEEPVGKRVFINLMSEIPLQVVGVVGDVRESGPDVPPHPEAYLPYPRLFFGSAHLVVRAQRDPLPLAREIRRQVRELDRNLPLGEVIPLERIAAARIANPTTDARILTCFAVTGLLLAAVGIYGVTAFTVARKRREIGVRIALGARSEDVVRTVLRQSAGWLGLGLLLGLGGGVLLSRLLASILYGVSPLDPWTFATMPLFLLAVALWAVYVPARGAAFLDPMLALAEP
jgi:putative ABC transport system permease protein